MEKNEYRISSKYLGSIYIDNLLGFVVIVGSLIITKAKILIVPYLEENVIFIIFFLSLGYIFFGDKLLKNRSIGKRIMGIEVNLLDGNRNISFFQVAQRRFLEMFFNPFSGKANSGKIDIDFITATHIFETKSGRILR